MLVRKKIKKEPIIVVINGTINTRGTYVHPYLITYIASWCSIAFQIETSYWIEEWKLFSKRNESNYWKSVFTCPKDYSFQKEKEIQKILKKKYNAKTEVKTKNGYIDVLTKDKIIEIKECCNWKHALGQIMAYSIYYPKREKVIYLFNVNEDLDEIKKTCLFYGVKVVVYRK